MRIEPPSDVGPRARISSGDVGGVLVVLGLLAVADVIWNLEGVGVVSFVLFGALVTWIWVVEYRAHRRVLQHLRRLPRAHWERTLGQLPLVTEAADLRLKLKSDPPLPPQVAVEAFAFPNAARRSTELAEVAVLLMAIVFVAAAFIGSLDLVVRVLLFAAGALSGEVGRRLHRRVQWLRSILEVSPFGLREIAADGSRRWVNWAQPLTLVNYPAEDCFKVAPPNSSDGLRIDYTRIEFWRLLELVVEYGGFKPELPHDPPDDSSDADRVAP